MIVVNDIYSLNRAAHTYSFSNQIDVAPVSAQNLSDSHPCTQADIDAKIAEHEIVDNILHNTPLMVHAQYLQLLVLLF